MKDNKIFMLVLILGSIVLVAAIYSEYAANKLERDRMMLASQGLQQYTQAISSGNEQGAIGSILSGLPLIGGLF